MINLLEFCFGKLKTWKIVLTFAQAWLLFRNKAMYNMSYAVFICMLRSWLTGKGFLTVSKNWVLFLLEIAVFLIFANALQELLTHSFVINLFAEKKYFA
jgi:hypothetical protein